jgi:hypothetical protein
MDPVLSPGYLIITSHGFIFHFRRIRFPKIRDVPHAGMTNGNSIPGPIL